MSLIVVGDLHLTNELTNPIKYKQSKYFMDWITEQAFNTPNNKLLFLGDVAEYNISYDTLSELTTWINSLNFTQIIWIQGNHDCISSDSILNAFKTNNKVKLITQPEIYDDIELDKKYLFLPHYEHIGTQLEKMETRYSNLHMDPNYQVDFDYGFAHICDDTQNFGDGKYCDTSNLKVKQWLNGHIHTNNIKNNGRYLGSVIKNSSTETNDIKYIAQINTDSMELIEVPTFLSYMSCEYGEFPTFDTPLAFFQINNSPSKYEAEAKYKAHYGENIGFNKILTVRQKLVEKSVVKESIDEEALFDEFATDKKLNNNIINICKETLGDL